MVENLKLFGLNLYERRAYDTLVREGTLTAHLIAKKSSVPTGKIYPVLESLVEKGFVSSSLGRPKMFVAISPEVVFESVVNRKEKDLKSFQKMAQKLVEEYSNLTNIKEEKEQDLVETYFGHSTAFARSVTLHNQSKKYWKTISRLTINKEHLDACSNALRRGVKILALTSPTETTAERVRQWKKRGVEVRFIEELPFRLSIYDDIGVVFRFSHEKSKQYVSTHIRNTKLAGGLSKFFDSLWLVASKKPPIPLK